MRAHPLYSFAHTRYVRRKGGGGVFKLKYGLFTLKYTTDLVLVYISQIRGAQLSPEVLARLDSMIASIIALDHANTPASYLLIQGTGGDWAAVVYLRLKYTGGVCIKYTTGGVLSITVKK